ncbi:hypothetical protein FCV25MIE_26984, partial [Fagus crenata]
YCTKISDQGHEFEKYQTPRLVCLILFFELPKCVLGSFKDNFSPLIVVLNCSKLK